MNKCDTIVLNNSSAELELRPGLGGAIQALRWNGHEILRSGTPHESDVTEMAHFPMVPVVNRIPDGQYEFNGRSIQLKANLPSTLDFIHGYGWMGPWTVAKLETSKAVLKFSYLPGSWPWAFNSIQKLHLENNGLWMELSIENKSNRCMPAALGFHPYFPITPQTRLNAQYEGYWENNQEQHALHRVTGSTRKDFTRGNDFIDTEILDTTHYNWQGPAIITETGRPTIKLTASQKAKHLHIYYQPDGTFVAIEPTSGRSNMFATQPQDYEILQPGQVFSIWMRIQVEQSARS